MFVRRSKPSRAHLEWRVRIFGAGGILALVGIWAEQGWLINVAIGVLLLGLGLRFLPERGEAQSDDDDRDSSAA